MAERTDVDAVVVGAGPAGAAAALALARAGRSVVLLERGPFPGSKNVYGGVVYGRVLDEIVPRWWEEVPVERWVVRRSTMMMTPTQSLSVDYRSHDVGCCPLQRIHDPSLPLRCLAGRQGDRGGSPPGALHRRHRPPARPRRAGGRRPHRPRRGRAAGQVVIACDGVNSFLAKEAGLHPRAEADHHTLGVKEVLDLPHEAINERFGVGQHEGVDIEILGCTGPVPGGGFLYTNRGR